MKLGLSASIFVKLAGGHTVSNLLCLTVVGDQIENLGKKSSSSFNYYKGIT